MPGRMKSPIAMRAAARFQAETCEAFEQDNQRAPEKLPMMKAKTPM
jgi:hypothetical protein